MCTFYRGTIESILTSCVTVWYGACNASCRKSLQRIVRAAEKIVGHLQHPSHPQSPLNCRWSHPPDTQLLQSAAIREETAESPGQDQQTEGQLHPSGCQEAKRPCPPLPSLNVQVIGVWWWVFGSRSAFKVTPEVFSWLGLVFLQTSQVLPHWLNHHLSLILALYTETLSC